MTHSEMDELYELYLLGVLESEEVAVITQHLSQDCEYCLGKLRGASPLVASLSSLTELIPPPAQLRERVLSIARPARQKSSNWSLLFGLACAASLGLLVWGVSENSTLNQTNLELQNASRQRDELRAAIEVMSESDTRTVKFGQAQSAPHGQVFVSRSGGVVFLGSHLPDLASGKTFQLWLVPAKGNPQSAGLFTTNAQGISVDVLARSINSSGFAAVAVSVEPNGGSPQPTSTPILIVPLA